jgi:hypothetical protein
MSDLATLPNASGQRTEQRRSNGHWRMPPAIERASAAREKPQRHATSTKPVPVTPQAAALPSIEIAGRALAKIASYNGLWSAVRARVEAMGITRIGTDTLSGLPDGYTGKLLGAAQVRRIGLNSLEKLLDGTGCYLVLVEDPAATEKLMAAAKEMHLFRRLAPRQLKLLPPPSPQP